MTDITTFPTIHDVLYDGDNIKDYTAGAAITAGQVVAIHGTGVDKTVHPAVKGTTGRPVGVALYTVASGEKVAVAGPGCRVYVANAESNVAIDAGDPLEDNDNAVGGTVSALALAGALAIRWCVGYADDDIAVSGTGVMTVFPHMVIDAAS